MKRTEMLNSIKTLLEAGKDWADLDTRAENMLASLEQLGMKPPHISDEDTQAIMGVYYGGYSVYQWDEDLEKDEAVQEMKRIRERAATARELNRIVRASEKK